MDKRRIDDLLSQDDWIEVKPAALPIHDLAEAKIAGDFEEICRFFDQNGREPQELSSGSHSINERTLFIRLKSIRAKPELAARLLPVDRHGLLKEQSGGKPLFTSLDEVLDDMDSLRDARHDDLFVLRHVTSETEKDDPDFIAGRHRCDDFAEFKPLFDAVANDLANGRRKTMRFINESEITQGDFYVLNGVTLYVASMDAFEARGKTRRKDARLRCIYDNGTEAALLFRSLSRLLYRDPNGRRISTSEAGPLFKPVKDEKPEDRLTGYVYVARCETVPTALKQYKNLVKVGVTTGNPRTRVAGAKDDPTFLFQRAVLVKHYALYNVTPMQVEAKIHAFLAGVCLDIETMDRFNKPYKPKEWFLVELPIVDEIVTKIIAGTLHQFQYDRIERRLVEA
jgi:hypothetical protein